VEAAARAARIARVSYFSVSTIISPPYADFGVPFLSLGDLFDACMYSSLGERRFWIFPHCSLVVALRFFAFCVVHHRDAGLGCQRRRLMRGAGARISVERLGG
jgi:hypothetical protein